MHLTAIFFIVLYITFLRVSIHSFHSYVFLPILTYSLYFKIVSDPVQPQNVKQTENGVQKDKSTKVESTKPTPIESSVGTHSPGALEHGEHFTCFKIIKSILMYKLTGLFVTLYYLNNRALVV